MSQIRTRAALCVRIGHPARFLASVVPYCLDEVVATSNGGEVVRGVRQDLDDLRRRLGEARGAAKAALWDEWRALKKELRKRWVLSHELVE